MFVGSVPFFHEVREQWKRAPLQNHFSSFAEINKMHYIVSQNIHNEKLPLYHEQNLKVQV